MYFSLQIFNVQFVLVFLARQKRYYLIGQHSFLQRFNFIQVSLFHSALAENLNKLLIFPTLTLVPCQLTRSRGVQMCD